MIIGSGIRAKRLSETLIQNSEWGVRIVGHLDPDPTRIAGRVLGSSVLGTVGDISSILKEHVIDEVLLAVPRAMTPNVDKIARAYDPRRVPGERGGLTIGADRIPPESLLEDAEYGFEVHVYRPRRRDQSPHASCSSS